MSESRADRLEIALRHLLSGRRVQARPLLPKVIPEELDQEDPVPIQKRRKNLPAPLCTAIHKALAREPEERFPDVGAFREALLPFREK